MDLPAVFHRVVCFNALAENAAASLDKGTPVAVPAEFADDTYKRENGTSIRRIQIEAADVAASLRYATATLVRNPRATTTPAPDAEPPAADSDTAPDSDAERPALELVGAD